MKFADIDRFPHSSYCVGVELKYLKEHLVRWDERCEELPHCRLIMDPEFQRGHVWTESQQVAFVEYLLKGGRMGRDVFFNCSSWQGNYTTPIYCLDGLQRITACLAFMDNKIKAFGHYLSEYEDNIRMADCQLMFHVLTVKKKKDLLKVYLALNSGGTPHDPQEIARVTKMFENTRDDETI